MEDLVLAYVKSLNLKNPKMISMETSIENDLGITGDDAVDFIDGFCKEFGINQTDIDLELYFNQESNSLFSFTKTKKKKDLKIKDFVMLCQNGKFDKL